MSQLANPYKERQKGILPSQSIMNPRNSQQAHLVEDQSLNQCNAVHTLSALAIIIRAVVITCSALWMTISDSSDLKGLGVDEMDA